MARRAYRWTNPSVLRFAGKRDPIKLITTKARKLVLDAMDNGWEGPPYDPIILAKILNTKLVPRNDIMDARTIPSKGDTPIIEYNPDRPPRRIRFSIAHEIAHTLFSDWGHKIRNRFSHENTRGNDWQLEMLCNIAAGELLMPVGSFKEIKKHSLTVDALVKLRDNYQVSSEAIFIRAINLTNFPCFMFSASRRTDHHGKDKYQIDYALPSHEWPEIVPRGHILPSKTAVSDCIAIGYTAKGEENWGAPLNHLKVECVGIPPYPNGTYPRVIGVAQQKSAEGIAGNNIVHVRGDATKPRGNGKNIIAHIVNDKSAIWGRGFGRALRMEYRAVQASFKNWAYTHEKDFCLGNIKITQEQENESLLFAHMICQHGFGTRNRAPLRYEHLAACLEKVASIALSEGATVHMPRIGTGEARGSWPLVEGLIEEILCAKNIPVIVYALPEANLEKGQQPLQFS